MACQRISLRSRALRSSGVQGGGKGGHKTFLLTWRQRSPRLLNRIYLLQAPPKHAGPGGVLEFSPKLLCSLNDPRSLAQVFLSSSG